MNIFHIRHGYKSNEIAFSAFVRPALPVFFIDQNLAIHVKESAIDSLLFARKESANAMRQILRRQALIGAILMKTKTMTITLIMTTNILNFIIIMILRNILDPRRILEGYE